MSICDTCNNCYVGIISGAVCAVDLEMGKDECSGFQDYYDDDSNFEMCAEYYDWKDRMEDMNYDE